MRNKLFFLLFLATTVSKMKRIRNNNLCVGESLLLSFKRICIIIILCHFSVCVVSQVVTNYYPKGSAAVSEIDALYIRSSLTKNMPSFDVGKVIEEDKKNEGKDVPYRFGKAFDVSYSLNDGEWTEVENGRIWNMSFKSNNAVSLNFVFNHFSLPEGAKMYIINQEKNIVYGPVTSKVIPSSGFFLTDIIPGECATLCLFEPEVHKYESSLIIKRVVHGYKDVVNEKLYGNYGASSPCNIDVQDYYPDYKKQSDAVGLVLLSGGTSICSGSLLMSTDYSFKPYFLSAFHCIDNTPRDSLLSQEEIEDAEQWLFKFQFKKEYYIGNSQITGYTYNGAYFRAGWYKSDFLLMEIRDNLKLNPKLSWLGWDRSGTTPSNGACLHHPRGDVMKISIIDSSFSSTSCFGLTNNLWDVYYDYGITERGSSGSPLLDNNKRVVGQLFRGDSFANPCLNMNDEFGKLSWSWNGGGQNYNRLMNWLDPIQTNQSTINGHYTTDFIMGPTIPCEISMYEIIDLPSIYSVSWRFLDTNSPVSNLLSQYGTKKCKIDNSSHTYINETLVADIMYNGDTINTFVKEINTGVNFVGTIEVLDASSSVYIAERPIRTGEGVLIESNCHVILKSQCFNNFTVTHSGGLVFNWTNSGNGEITFDAPSILMGLSQQITITGKNGCECFKIKITIVPPLERVLQNSSIRLDVSSNSSNYNFTLVDQKADNNSTTIYDDQNKKWQLLIYKASNGTIIFHSENYGRTVSVDTSGWESGVYIARAVINGKDVAKKITIRKF